MKKTNDNISYLETQELKELLLKIIISTFKSMYDVRYVEHNELVPHVPINNDNPLRSINFDIFDGKVMQLNNDSCSNIIDVISRETDGSNSLYSVSNKYYRDIPLSVNTNLYEKWITLAIKSEYNIESSESTKDLLGEIFNIISSIEKIITSKNNNLFQSFTLEDEISFFNWKTLSKKYNFLDPSDIFKKIAKSNKLNIFGNCDNYLLKELSYYDLKINNRKNLLLITYYNQYANKPVIIGTLSKVDYNNKEFKFSNNDSYKYYGDKIIAEVNLDSLTMVMLNKHSISEVK